MMPYTNNQQTIDAQQSGRGLSSPLDDLFPTLQRRYQLLGMLGQGGMGRVYHVFDRLMLQEVALKTVIFEKEDAAEPYSAGDQRRNEAESYPTGQQQHSMGESRLALAHEFQLLSTLRHPHIISVYDYGFSGERLSGSRAVGRFPYFTMDYLADAQPFDRYSYAVSLSKKFELIEQILLGLIYLHRRQIIHRDIKPANVLVSQEKVHVLDFGLATLRSDAPPSGGTLAYFAPELIRGGEATIQSDLYAVGVLAFEALAGLLPFEPSEPAFIEQVLHNAPEYLFVDAPEPVVAVLRRLLAKRPEARYRTAEEGLIAFCRACNRPPPPETIHIRESFLQNAAFVGREAEQAQIISALRATSAQPLTHGRAILIGGESGVGKSRLVRECKSRALVAGFHLFEGENRQEEQRGYQLWERTLERLVLTLPSIDDDQLRVLKPIVPRLEALVGRSISDAPQLPKALAEQRLISTIVALFVQIETPTLLILEDLQWHSGDLSLIKRLLRLTRQKPLMVLGTFRHDEAPQLAAQLPEMELITLGRFDAVAIAQLSQSILGDLGLRPDIQKLLQDESEGNVFFLVEIVRALAELSGQLSQIGDVPLRQGILPRGIRSMIDNRLQQIPADLQMALKLTGLTGRQIDPALVNHYLRKVQPESPYSVDQFLLLCSNAAILELYNGSWRFAHDKIRQGIVQLIEEEALARYHTEIAIAYESCYPADASIAEHLVTHWQAAGDRQKEGRYAYDAARYFRSIYKNEIALEYANRTIALSEGRPIAALVDGLKLRETLNRLRGKRDDQLADIDALAEIARRERWGGAARLGAEVKLLRALFASNLGEYQTVVTLLSDMHFDRSDQADSGLWMMRYEASFLKGEAYIRMGQHGDGVALCLDILEKMEDPRRLSDTAARQLVAKTANLIGISYTKQGRYADAMRYREHALKAYVALGDKLGESTALFGIGILLYKEKKMAQSTAFYERADRLLAEVNDMEGRAKILTNLHVNAKLMGEFEAAIQYAEEALRIAININSTPGKLFNLINLMWIYTALHDFNAVDVYRSIINLNIDESPNRFYQAVVHLDIGLTFLIENRIDVAQAHLEKAEAIAGQLDDQSLLVESKIGFLLLYAMGGWLEAGNALAKRLILLIRHDPDFFSRQTHPFLAFAILLPWLERIEPDFYQAVLTQAAEQLQNTLKLQRSAARREHWSNHTLGVPELLARLGWPGGIVENRS